MGQINTINTNLKVTEYQDRVTGVKKDGDGSSQLTMERENEEDKQPAELTPSPAADLPSPEEPESEIDYASENQLQEADSKLLN